MEGETHPRVRRGTVRRALAFLWLFLQFLIESFVDAVSANARIMYRESDLFLGAALFFIGAFGFNTGKFCDGNTADYLSCTRPTAYHYYGAVDIALIVVGSFFVILWFMKRRA